MTDKNLFLELLRASLGSPQALSRKPSGSEWEDLYSEARRQSVIGLCLQAIQQDGGKWGEENGLPIDLKLKWIGKAEKIADENKKLNQQCRQLSEKLTRSGYWNCILKGQGIATLYPHPEWRQSGDIDIWIPGSRRKIVEMTRRVSQRKEEVMYHHTNFRVFPDTEVEVHFKPSWMFNPITNRRLQKWFKSQVGLSEGKDFPIPTIDFNLIFILLHICRHVFDGGVGWRQVIDYFYTLKQAQGRNIPDLNYFGLQRFARALMWVMGEALAMPVEWMIAEPDEVSGRWLLNEIQEAGNFGHFDKRNEGYQFTHNRLRRLVWRLRMVSQRIRLFPGETFWEMPWRTWHYLWRMKNGYL
jgi:hypothetical protein